MEYYRDIRTILIWVAIRITDTLNGTFIVTVTDHNGHCHIVAIVSATAPHFHSEKYLIDASDASGRGVPKVRLLVSPAIVIDILAPHTGA